jgi:glycosyltransferase involved in cell wall biosynthesis
VTASGERLRILYVTPIPPSPPRFGAQARMHGLMTQVARRHDITAVSLVDQDFHAEESVRAMREYCRDVVLVPNRNGRRGVAKRSLQLRSLASARSFEHHLYSVPALQEALDRTLLREQFDVVNVEFPSLVHARLRQSPGGSPLPAVVLNAHEIMYDLARQIARRAAGVGRRLYGSLNWRKLRREEQSAFRTADGIYVCSVADQARVAADIPSARTVVVPNAADVDFFQPRPSDPPSDGRTVVFFGLLSTVPNIEGATFLVNEIWPLIAASRPNARCKIIGAWAHPSVRRLAGPGIEVIGPVEDLRPHLASAAVIVVPLRIGGGTRLKIVEAMAMGKAIVSTSLGAEGIDAVPERDILIADDAASFARSVIRVLDDPALRRELGRAARELAVQRYSWAAAASRLERFFGEILVSRAQR